MNVSSALPLFTVALTGVGVAEGKQSAGIPNAQNKPLRHRLPH
jgi:hypothetical protein